jgi:hypothetical protein
MDETYGKPTHGEMRNPHKVLAGKLERNLP